jgi:hypothetical protein
MMTLEVTMSSLRTAIKKNPNDTVSRMAIADAYEEQGNLEEASKQREVCGWIEKFSSVEAIKRDSLRQGDNWFDPDTIRFFKCRLSTTVYIGSNGIFFVSSERSWTECREHTVRRYDAATGMVATHSRLGQYKTRASALTAAKRAAGE